MSLHAQWPITDREREGEKERGGEKGHNVTAADNLDRKKQSER